MNFVVATVDVGPKRIDHLGLTLRRGPLSAIPTHRWFRAPCQTCVVLAVVPVPRVGGSIKFLPRFVVFLGTRLSFVSTRRKFDTLSVVAVPFVQLRVEKDPPTLDAVVGAVGVVAQQRATEHHH